MADYRTEAKALVKVENPLVLEEVCKILRKEHVRKDALAYITDDYRFKKSLEDYSDDEVELADAIAERFVYDGDYDCNSSYWDNIKTLYDEITTSDMDPETKIAA